MALAMSAETAQPASTAAAAAGDGILHAGGAAANGTIVTAAPSSTAPEPGLAAVESEPGPTQQVQSGSLLLHLGAACPWHPYMLHCARQ